VIGTAALSLVRGHGFVIVITVLTVKKVHAFNPEILLEVLCD